MGLDAFSSRLGLDQGRLPVDGGDFVFVLGGGEGWSAVLDDGDYVEIRQVVDVTDVDLIRVRGVLRAPADAAAAGLAWRAEIRVQGILWASQVGYSGRDTDVSDLAANVSKITGVRLITLRLALVSV